MPAILPDTPAVEAAIIEMTNAYRRENKLAEVAPAKKLTAAARAYAAYLAKSGEFSHTADGRQPADRITSAGYSWCQVGENLALHIDSRGFLPRALAEKSVTGWINSPGHRKNMLAPYVTEIGVGVAKAPGPEVKYISVQLFARPKSLQYEFQISNTAKEAVRYSFGGETHEVRPSFAVTHTACNPSEILFESVGSTSLSLTYQAANGLSYVLRGDRTRGLDVEVAPLAKP